MKKFLYNLISLSLLFYSCSASTGGRYEKEENNKDKNEVKDIEKPELIIEDFDFTPYRTKPDIPKKETSLPTYNPQSEIWYGYDNTELDTSVSEKKIIDKVQGYRVLIFTADNLDEANSMRSEIYFNTTEKDVYVIFDPPFYKVMVGDFTEYSDAQNLSFKLNQLGYQESRVVNETINIFE